MVTAKFLLGKCDAIRASMSVSNERVMDNEVIDAILGNLDFILK
jgi:hypothetical protein